MTKYFRTEIDCETGEENLVELSPEEAAEVKSFADKAKAEENQLLAEAEAKKALLEKLGLTVDEANLLLK